MPLIEKGLYRNWDGSVYRVLGFTYDPETKEKVVVFQLNMKTSQNGGYEVAKYTMSPETFVQLVPVRGEMVPRFTRIDDA